MRTTSSLAAAAFALFFFPPIALSRALCARPRKQRSSRIMAPVETVESSGPSMWDAASHNEIPKEHWCVSSPAGHQPSPGLRGKRRPLSCDRSVRQDSPWNDASRSGGKAAKHTSWCGRTRHRIWILRRVSHMPSGAGGWLSPTRRGWSGVLSRTLTRPHATLEPSLRNPTNIRQHPVIAFAPRPFFRMGGKTPFENSGV